MDEGDLWVTMTQAGQLAGCSHSLVAGATKRGEIIQRRAPRNQPSLDRESVMLWAERRRARLEERARARRDKQRRRQLGGRPNLDHVWLDYGEVAELLGCTPRWVSYLANQDRLPFTEAGGRRWFRRDHLKMWRAAREIERHNDQ